MILWIGYGTETGSFSQIKISPWIRTRFLWENLCRHLSAEILNTNCSKVSENRVNECYSYTSTHTMLSSTHGPQPHQQYSDRFASTFTHIYLCGVLNRSIQPTGLAHWEISLGLVHAFKYLYVFICLTHMRNILYLKEFQQQQQSNRNTERNRIKKNNTYIWSVWISGSYTASKQILWWLVVLCC